MWKFLLNLLEYLIKFISDFPVITVLRKVGEENLEITILVVFIILLIYLLYKFRKQKKK